MVEKTKWSPLIFGLCLSLLVIVVSPSQDLMKKLSTEFGRALNECRKELNFGDHIMQDFMNYWKEDYQLLNREFGCTIMCMAAKHELVDDEGKLHHENTHAFTKKHGADDDQAKQLVELIHECEKNRIDDNDPCMIALDISKCFKTKIHELKWAPSMEEIVSEVMAEFEPKK